jgi:hypothetical protein
MERVYLLSKMEKNQKKETVAALITDGKKTGLLRTAIFVGILLTMGYVLSFAVSLDLSKGSEPWRASWWAQENKRCQTELAPYTEVLKKIGKLEAALRKARVYIEAIKYLKKKQIGPWQDVASWQEGMFISFHHGLESIIRSFEEAGARLYAVTMQTPKRVVLTFLQEGAKGPSEKRLALWIQRPGASQSRPKKQPLAQGPSKGASGRPGVVYKGTLAPQSLAQGRGRDPIQKTPTKKITVIVRIRELLAVRSEGADWVGPIKPPLKDLGVENGKRQWRILWSEGMGSP